MVHICNDVSVITPSQFYFKKARRLGNITDKCQGSIIFIGTPSICFVINYTKITSKITH